LQHEQSTLKERIKENQDKIKLNKQLPYLVGNVVELLDQEKADEEVSLGAFPSKVQVVELLLEGRRT
jgi:26S proteasome regulatory subunit T5